VGCLQNIIKTGLSKTLLTSWCKTIDGRLGREKAIESKLKNGADGAFSSRMTREVLNGRMCVLYRIKLLLFQGNQMDGGQKYVKGFRKGKCSNSWETSCTMLYIYTTIYCIPHTSEEKAVICSLNVPYVSSHSRPYHSDQLEFFSCRNSQMWFFRLAVKAM